MSDQSVTLTKDPISNAVESISRTGLIRYDIVPGFPDEVEFNYKPDGEWVRYADVEGELNQLRQDLARYENAHKVLVSENQRLQEREMKARCIRCGCATFRITEQANGDRNG